jgi:L-lysine 2,3-aminomutase
LFQNSRLKFYFIIHSNHPLELDAEVLRALATLNQAGVMLLNQSVLLKGVNDDKETLKELCLKLVYNNIIPYYLHQLDPVQGAAHFEVSEEIGKKLIAQLSKELPGYAVPRYVKEIAGESSKTLLR